jgi:hypothetical protein
VGTVTQLLIIYKLSGVYFQSKSYAAITVELHLWANLQRQSASITRSREFRVADCDAF